MKPYFYNSVFSHNLHFLLFHHSISFHSCCFFDVPFFDVVALMTTASVLLCHDWKSKLPLKICGFLCIMYPVVAIILHAVNIHHLHQDIIVFVSMFDEVPRSNANSTFIHTIHHPINHQCHLFLYCILNLHLQKTVWTAKEKKWDGNEIIMIRKRKNSTFWKHSGRPFVLCMKFWCWWYQWQGLLDGSSFLCSEVNIWLLGMCNTPLWPSHQGSNLSELLCTLG